MMASRRAPFVALLSLLWLSTVLAHPFLSTRPRFGRFSEILTLRGGDDEDNEPSLDEKVRKAMAKLGIQGPNAVEDGETTDCPDGVCPIPEDQEAPPQQLTQEEQRASIDQPASNDAETPSMADRLAAEFGVDVTLAQAAIGATAETGEDGSVLAYQEDAARELLAEELSRVQHVPDDAPEVEQLASEGFNRFLCRRALAFADMDIDNARAILIAERIDEEEEENEPPAENFRTVNVEADFDPTRMAEPAPAPSAPQGAPPPANKAEVVFEATAADVQQLVLESPVPVLLDIYADWCGPCKALSPILEEMAVKGGGAFRLVKVNADNERAVSGALSVQSLPTVFGVRDGKIVNMFMGMPRSQEAIQSFMMGLLVNESHFNPPVSEEQKQHFMELTLKLVKMACAASFPFSARERLQERVLARLDELAAETGDFFDAEASCMTLRSLLSNVVRDPYEPKFRNINLANKKIAATVARYQASLAVLKSVGFSAADDSTLVIGQDKTLVNVAPLLVARDCIDNWLDKSRYEVAKATRKRKDEEARAQLQLDVDEEESEEEEVEEVDPNACKLKIRMEGKKKVHEVELHADYPLSAVLDNLPVDVGDDEDVQITCVAKRLVIKSRSDERMDKSFRDLGLSPAAALVVTVGEKAKADASTLSKRASQKKKKKGSHTMQSVGIYAKDDNAKAELIDGGGGVWYEHDVSSDDEAEEDEEDAAGEADQEEEIVDNEEE